MKRREFIPLIDGAMLGWRLGGSAQQCRHIRRNGVLVNPAEDDLEGQARLKFLRRRLPRF
jgi:hypothetical protein